MGPLRLGQEELYPPAISRSLARYDDGLQNTRRRVCGPNGMKSFWSGEETRRSGDDLFRGKVVGSIPTGPTNNSYVEI